MDDIHSITELLTLREVNRELQQTQDRLRSELQQSQSDHATLRVDHDVVLAALQTVKDERDQLLAGQRQVEHAKPIMPPSSWGRI